MAHRKCVIGTDISGLRQALGDDASKKFLAPPKDVDYLAQLIAKYLDSDSARREAGSVNRHRIEREFSPEKMLNAVLQGISVRQQK